MEIRKLDKKELSANMELFCNLYHTVFTAAANKEIIEQRYLENPYGELLMYVAIDDNKIVANYSAVPIRVVIEGVERKAALSLNTMTDPAYTGRGLFSKLAAALYEYLDNSGYAMIIGFPNYMSNRTFNTRLGWSSVLEIPTMKLELETYQVANDEDREGFGNTFDGVSSNEKKDDIHVYLSNEYITWRFKNNKEKKYRILSLDKNNWIIYQFYNDELNITEISCDDGNKERILLQQIINIGKEESFSYITTWCKVNTKRHCYLEKLGFKLTSPIRTFGLRCFDESIADKAYDPRRWSIQMGDDNTY